MPVCRTNVEALLQIRWGCRISAMEFQAHLLGLRDGLRCRASVISAQFVVHSEELIHFELPLECVEQRGLAATVRPQQDDELRVRRQVVNREIDETFEFFDSG